MKKRLKSKTSAGPRVDPYLEGLMAKLLERLVSVERKMDVVISQTSQRPSGGNNPPKASQNPPPPQQPRRDRTLYEAICADCHKVCEVPFRPSEARPVYCKECFAKRKAGKNGGPGNVYPVLTPVALPPKPVSKLNVAQTPAPPAHGTPKKIKKSTTGKKLKKTKKRG